MKVIQFFWSTKVCSENSRNTKHNCTTSVVITNMCLVVNFSLKNRWSWAKTGSRFSLKEVEVRETKRKRYINVVPKLMCWRIWGKYQRERSLAWYLYFAISRFFSPYFVVMVRLGEESQRMDACLLACR